MKLKQNALEKPVLHLVLYAKNKKNDEEIFKTFVEMLKNNCDEEIIDFIEKLTPHHLQMKDSYYRNLFFYAVVSKRNNIVIKLLEKGSSYDATDNVYHMNAVELAEQFSGLTGKYKSKSKYEIYGMLLNHRESLMKNTDFSLFFNVLTLAVKSHNLEAVQSILTEAKKSGHNLFQCINFMARDPFKDIAESNPAIFSALVEAGYIYQEIITEQNCGFYHETPHIIGSKVFQWAANGQLDLVKICIPQLFDPNLRIINEGLNWCRHVGKARTLGRTILQIAAQSGQFEVVKFLLENKADPNPITPRQASEQLENPTRSTAIEDAILGLALSIETKKAINPDDFKKYENIILLLTQYGVDRDLFFSYAGSFLLKEENVDVLITNIDFNMLDRDTSLNLSARLLLPAIQKGYVLQQATPEDVGSRLKLR